MAVAPWAAPLVGGGYWVALAQAVIVYYLGALLLHYVAPALFPVRSIQKGQPRPGQVATEAANSIVPLAIKAGMWTIVERLHASGHSKLYDGKVSGPREWAYMLAVVVALDYLHDAWFYWTHRLLHWKPLYLHVHLMHHRSTVPTAFCGYSFHAVEALIVFANEVLVCFLFPIHLHLHRAYHIFTTVIHCGGHAGYEIAPFIPSLEALALLAVRGARAGPPPPLNTVLHHDMHHRFPNCHFSLYMTHWDRLCGTEHPQYRSVVRGAGARGSVRLASRAAG